MWCWFPYPKYNTWTDDRHGNRTVKNFYIISAILEKWMVIASIKFTNSYIINHKVLPMTPATSVCSSFSSMVALCITSPQTMVLLTSIDHSNQLQIQTSRPCPSKARKTYIMIWICSPQSSIKVRYSLIKYGFKDLFEFVFRNNIEFGNCYH